MTLGLAHDNTTPRLAIVNGEHLRSVWLAVRERVQAIAERGDYPWIADDVFHAIVTGQAWLWTTADPDGGFVVLEISSTPFQRDLHVWIADNQGEGSAAGFIPQLREIARSCGCQRVTWSSVRSGFARAIPNVSVEYQYAVEA